MVRNESYWTRELMAYLARHHPSWLYYKLADTFTSGIPDVVVNAASLSTWLELKVLRPKQTISDRINMKSDRHAKLQLHDMLKLHKNRCPAWYLFFLPTADLRFVMYQAHIVEIFVRNQAAEPTMEQLAAMASNNFSPVSRLCAGEVPIVTI